MAGGFAANLTRIHPRASDDERKKCEDLSISNDDFIKHNEKTKSAENNFEGEHCIWPKRDWNMMDIHRSCLKCHGASGKLAFMFDGNTWNKIV